MTDSGQPIAALMALGVANAFSSKLSKKEKDFKEFDFKAPPIKKK